MTSANHGLQHDLSAMELPKPPKQGGGTKNDAPKYAKTTRCDRLAGDLDQRRQQAQFSRL